MMEGVSDSAAIGDSVSSEGGGMAIEPADILASAACPSLRSDMAAVADSEITNEVSAALRSSVHCADSELTEGLVQVIKSTETRVLDALNQAAVDIVENLGNQAALHLVMAGRKAAVLEREVENTKIQALQMLIRQAIMASMQTADHERKLLLERKRAQEADVKIQNLQDVLKRTRAELKRKTDMVEELQKRVQLDDDEIGRGLQSTSEGLERKKLRGSRAKGQANAAQEMQDKPSPSTYSPENISHQHMKAQGTIYVGTDDFSAFRNGDAPPSKRQKGLADSSVAGNCTPDIESRARPRNSKATDRTDKPTTCASGTAQKLRSEQLCIGAGGWEDRDGTQPEESAPCLGSQKSEDPEAKSSSRDGSDTQSPCGEAPSVEPPALPEYSGSGGLHQDKLAKRGSRTAWNGNTSEHSQDESILECREPGIQVSDKPNSHGEQQSPVQAGDSDYERPKRSDHPGYGFVLVNDGEADRPRWRAVSPLSSSRQKVSPTQNSKDLPKRSNTGSQAVAKQTKAQLPLILQTSSNMPNDLDVAQQRLSSANEPDLSGEILLASVAEQELVKRASSKSLPKRKRREKLSTPEAEAKKTERMTSSSPGAAQAAIGSDAQRLLTENSRDSRRLMQGARQLLSLRRGNKAD